MPIPPRILRIIRRTGYWLHSRAVRALLTKAEKTGKKPLNERMAEQVAKIHARSMSANYLTLKAQEKEIERWARILQMHARAVEEQQEQTSQKADVIWFKGGHRVGNSGPEPKRRNKS